MPQKQPIRRRWWLNDGSCVRLRPAYRDHVWSYDFVQDRTSDECNVSEESLPVLLRRLTEEGSEAAGSLRTAILLTLGIEEV